MALAHHGRGRGDVRARGGRARARRAALGGGGRHALRHCATLSNTHMGNEAVASRYTRKLSQLESVNSTEAMT